MAKGDNRTKFTAAIKCANTEETVCVRREREREGGTGSRMLSISSRSLPGVSETAPPPLTTALETYPAGNDQAACRRDAKPVVSIGQYLPVLVLII